ncbi:hypothetical protein ACIRD3_14275 [Kitasatospora sp. NPDC093550]|uniref:hypothetical protein n=1 Tax=Kitasatospora sp. NPDC093550 TaxID=3364089 RepID=UPI0038213044
MPVQEIRLPQFAVLTLAEDETPRVMTDSAAERAWIPAYQAVPTYAKADQAA